MLTLYHTARAVCPQKVRLAIAEKGLAYESRLLAPEELRSPEYLALNRNGYVPTLLHDNHALTESRTISEYIDEAFPDPPLMPLSPAGRATVRNWTKQIDEGLHLNIFVVSFVASIRRAYLALPSDIQQRRLPLNTVKRQVMLDLAEKGHKSTFFKMAIDRFFTLFDDMEHALNGYQWLGGEGYSLADTDFTPYLRRLEELGFWHRVQKHYPNVTHWFEAVRSRPSFAVAMTSWESDADRLREAEDIVLASPIFDQVLAD